MPYLILLTQTPKRTTFAPSREPHAIPAHTIPEGRFDLNRSVSEQLPATIQPGNAQSSRATRAVHRPDSRRCEMGLGLRGWDCGAGIGRCHYQRPSRAMGPSERPAWITRAARRFADCANARNDLKILTSVPRFWLAAPLQLRGGRRSNVDPHVSLVRNSMSG